MDTNYNISQCNASSEQLFRRLYETRSPQNTVDEKNIGGLAFGIGSTVGKVVITFSQPVTWLELSVEEAKDFGFYVLHRAILANEERNRSTEGMNRKATP